MAVTDTVLARMDYATGSSLPAGRVLLLILIAGCLLGQVTRASAQDSGSQQIELAARAGYDGYYKNDFWVPVRVTVANRGPDIQGFLQIVSGNSSRNDEVLYRSPVTLPTSSNKGLTLYVQAPSFMPTLAVELLDESERVIATTETNKLSGLSSDALLYTVVTREPGRLEYLEDISAGRSDTAVAYIGLDELPEVGAALNAIDVLIFHNEDSGKITAEQRNALEGWLDTGGQLVVTGGPSWQETSAGLADLLPVDISGTVSFDDIPSLLELGKVPFRDPGPYLVTEDQLRSGEVLIQQDGTPLLSRKDYGVGSVFYLALDPMLAPLLDWQGSQAVWSEIVSFAQPLPEWAKGARNSYTAASAVSSLPESDLPGAWALLIFLVIYIIVVGPVNYLVLRRTGRREMAWLTIPSLVIMFSVGAYVVGFQLKGDEVIVNQMSIVYGQAGGEQVRVQTLIGLYSPRRASYDVLLPAESVPRPFEASFGTLGGEGNIEAIERAESVVVSDLQVDIGGVETLVADSYQPSPEVSGSVLLKPGSGNDVIVELHIQNNGTFTLENVTLLVGSAVVSLGDLVHGDSIDRAVGMATLTGTGTGATTYGYVPVPPETSPLLANTQSILGSTQFYDDRKTYSRWQLLQSMAPNYTTNSTSYVPVSYTLIAWSDQPQLDLKLRGDDHDSMATSLYFLKLPVSQQLSSQPEITVPRSLLNWAVLADDGAYNARIEDLLLRTGSVEFEFTPWSDFRAMQVRDLAIILEPATGMGAQRPPQISLWDWSTGSGRWRTLDESSWGRTVIEDDERYIGPSNTVRVQLNNAGPETINIRRIYPEMTGSMK